jgi:hypothetical protein
LISLEREIPMLVKGTDDTVETWSSQGHGILERGKLEQIGEPWRQRERQRLERMFENEGLCGSGKLEGF